MTIVSSYTVAQKGIGKPDYSKHVSSALERAGIRVAYNQQLKMFALVFTDSPSVFSWVRGPLDPGASAHLIDQETGDATPYNLSVGYTIAIVSIRVGLSQDNQFEVIYDAFPAGGAVLSGIDGGGIPIYQEDLLPFTTAILDPTGASAHTLDDVITNLGAADLYGGIAKLALLTAVGTPPFPTTKTTRCKFCGNKEVKPITATSIICSKCGKLYIVYDLSKIKGNS